jgi:hypothetical protein
LLLGEEVLDRGCLGSGGPGRGRSQRAAGMVKRNHQRPMRKRTRRREKVVLFIRTRITIERHCRKSPAL